MYGIVDQYIDRFITLSTPKTIDSLRLFQLQNGRPFTKSMMQVFEHNGGAPDNPADFLAAEQIRKEAALKWQYEIGVLKGRILSGDLT